MSPGVGALTEFFFVDPQKVGLSIARTVVVVGPISALLIWSARPYFRGVCNWFGPLTDTGYGLSFDLRLCRIACSTRDFYFYSQRNAQCQNSDLTIVSP